MDALHQYFDAIRNRDWKHLAECLAENVERTGPYLDVVRGRQAYVDFIAGVIPSLPNYSLSVSRIDQIDASSALVKLSETLDVKGIPTEFPELLRFDLDEDGRILRVDIYIKQPPAKGSPPHRGS